MPTMWPALRLAVARAARPSRALPVGSASSRVVVHRAAAVVRYRSANPARGFAVTAGRSEPLADARAIRAGRPKAGRKTATKKAQPKTKTKAKAKSKPKPKPKKRVRKVLTPEEKKTAEVRALKAAALLKEPPRLPDRTWLVYVVQHTKGNKLSTGGLTDSMAAISQSFKALTTSDLQRLQDTAQRNKLANNATYKAWVESHTAEEVADANKARARLQRLSAGKRRAIQDDRQPKRPVTTYSLFCKSRWASGDFAGQSINDASKALAAEWKALSGPARKPYEDLSKAEVDRYEKEVLDVLGRKVQRSNTS